MLFLGARSTLISTVKQTIISLDNLLPSSLMHINWSMLRKPWLNQVNSCSTPKDFKRVMVVLMSCIKPVVYASVWHEQLGKYFIYNFLFMIVMLILFFVLFLYFRSCKTLSYYSCRT